MRPIDSASGSAFSMVQPSTSTRLKNHIAEARTPAAQWKSIGRFDGSCQFSTWLYAILVHRFQKSLRRARSRPVPLASLPVREAEQQEILLERVSDAELLPGEALLQKELNTQLEEAIHALPPKHQQVLLLRFYEEASLPEIAGALGLSLGTVKSRLHHALEKLRKMKSIVNLFDRTRDT